MKLKKKSGLMGAVIALSAASLVSVGFAAWVISAGTTEAVQGNIQVDTVTKNIYKINFVSGGSKANAEAPYVLTKSVVFGYKAYDETAAGVPSYGWLTNDTKLYGTGEDNSSAENLKVSFTFKVLSNDGTTDTEIAPTTNAAAAQLVLDDSLNYHLSASAVTCEGYTTTIGTYANVLGALPQPLISYSAEDEVYTCEVEFKWGSKFRLGATDDTIVNPMTYYNSKPYSQDLADEAFAILDGINDVIDGLLFNFTLTIAQ